MTPLVAVLDASVTAAWFLPDEASDASDRVYALLRKGTLVLHAPQLWLWECGNIVVNAVRRRRLDAEDARLAWSAVEAIASLVRLTVPERSDAAQALPLALSYRLSLYDAAYLGLASTLRVPLLTQDRALARAASAHSVRSLTSVDLP